MGFNLLQNSGLKAFESFLIFVLNLQFSFRWCFETGNELLCVFHAIIVIIWETEPKSRFQQMARSLPDSITAIIQLYLQVMIKGKQDVLV